MSATGETTDRHRPAATRAGATGRGRSPTSPAQKGADGPMAAAEPGQAAPEPAAPASAPPESVPPGPIPREPVSPEPIPPEPTPWEQRHAPAATVVRRYTLGSMAIGLVPIPLADLAALFTLQLKMLHSLAGIYGVAFKADLGRAAIASLAGGALPVAASPSLAASLGKLVPGIGQTLAAGSLVLLNGAATYALGKVFTQHFASGGTFLSFDPEAVRDYFQEQMKEGRRVAQAMREGRGKP